MQLSAKVRVKRTERGVQAHQRRAHDACGGAAVVSIGHGNEEVIAAGLAQMQKVSYVHTGFYSTTVAEELAHTILDGNTHGLEKAVFVGSGKSFTTIIS